MLREQNKNDPKVHGALEYIILKKLVVIRGKMVI